MPSILPINLDDLLYGRNIESSARRVQASWDEKTTGPQVVRTLMCLCTMIFKTSMASTHVVIGVVRA